MSCDYVLTIHKQDPERKRFTMCGLRVKLVNGAYDPVMHNCMFCNEETRKRHESIPSKPTPRR